MLLVFIQIVIFCWQVISLIPNHDVYMTLNRFLVGTTISIFAIILALSIDNGKETGSETI